MAAASTIFEFLGGRKALGVKSTSAVDWEALIRAGLPVQSAEALKAGIAVPDSLLGAC